MNLTNFKIGDKLTCKKEYSNYLSGVNIIKGNIYTIKDIMGYIVIFDNNFRMILYTSNKNKKGYNEEFIRELFNID